VARGDERLELFGGRDLLIDLPEAGQVVHPRRLLGHRQKPDAVDAEALEIRQLRLERGHAVTPVSRTPGPQAAPRVQLAEHRPREPLRPIRRGTRIGLIGQLRTRGGNGLPTAAADAQELRPHLDLVAGLEAGKRREPVHQAHGPLPFLCVHARAVQKKRVVHQQAEVAALAPGIRHPGLRPRPPGLPALAARRAVGEPRLTHRVVTGQAEDRIGSPAKRHTRHAEQHAAELHCLGP